MEEHAVNPRGSDAVHDVLYYEDGSPVRIPEDRAENGDTGLRFADSCLRTTDGKFNNDYIKKWIADNYTTRSHLIKQKRGGNGKSKSFLISAKKTIIGFRQDKSSNWKLFVIDVDEGVKRGKRKLSEGSGTSGREMIADANLLRELVSSGQLIEAYKMSVSMAQCVVPAFVPYIARGPGTTTYSEYCTADHYGDAEFGHLFLEETNRAETEKTMGWSYRLLLYQYQRYFIKLLNNQELQMALMGTKHIKEPNCFNCLTYCPPQATLDSLFADIALIFDNPGAQAAVDGFKDYAVKNIDYHLHVGLYFKYGEQTGQQYEGPPPVTERVSSCDSSTDSNSWWDNLL